ncbi:hypothetical protein C8F04DRAFT_1040646 [Mycena alexandri]|uniref:NACHT domain-containing protein n=1 Tax=Mycena alexandri TaxID=1745969 RepID=A0AAD6STJ1_9AGAR|nr:hypothetical protein C8F04DRAFT_1040646 [Mycena alexandri]
MAETLGTLASILQLVDTALKAREYVKDFHDAPKEQNKLFSEMEDLKLLLTELHKHAASKPASGAFQQMSGPLAVFKNTMESFTAKLGPVDGLSKFTKRLTWSLWSKKEAADYLQELERIKSLINVWLTTDIWDVGQKQMSTQDGRFGIERLFLRVNPAQAEKRRAIIDWMSPLNFLQRQAEVFSMMQPGTGKWLLSDAQFKTWESDSGKVLWCRGMPGAGKTVLASLVVSHLEAKAQRNNLGIACTFLNHKEAEIQTVPNILGGLWKQLVLGKPVPTGVSALYDYHMERQTRPQSDEFIKALNSAAAEYHKVYLVIDALDEYPEDRRHLFLQFLRTASSQVNIMVTSRPHINLESIFPNLQILDIQATEDDIREYLDGQFKASSRLSKHIQARPELHDEIQSRIISNSQGMFLLAKLHIESLVAKHTVRAVRDALKHLPTGLWDTYAEAMQRIDRQSKEDKDLAMLTLTWVVNAKRPLSVAELKQALAIEPESTCLDVDSLLEIDIILSVCAGLIIVDESSSVVRLIHYTTQEYMDSKQADLFPLAQTTIVSSCLTYLSFKEFEKEKRFDFKETSMQQENPFILYAPYCLMHAKGDPEIRRMWGSDVSYFGRIAMRRDVSLTLISDAS